MGQELTGKKIAILAEDLYEDTELWYPYYRLLEAGAEVKIVGSGRAESFKSKHDLPVVPDLSIDRTSAAEFDAVVIPGGYSPDLMRRKPAMVEFVREMDKAGKPVAAICHAGWMLISAGIVNGNLPRRLDAHLGGHRQGAARHVFLLDQGRHGGSRSSLRRRGCRRRWEPDHVTPSG